MPFHNPSLGRLSLPLLCLLFALGLPAAEWPGGRWEQPLTEDYEQWKPVREVIVELAGKAGVTSVTVPAEATATWMVPLAKGLTLRQALERVAALSGLEPGWEAGQLAMKTAKPARWNPTLLDCTETVVQLGGTLGQGRIFLPRGGKANGPMPWVWYAPNGLAPANAWMCKRLLDAGIAVTVVGVGESMGNPAGRAAFTAFYGKATSEHGLAKKAVLLPQSRGGLMLYNWAAEHPECVAAIGGIYPVGDLRSYPGLEKAGAAYGLKPAELEAVLAQHNPIERLAPLAKARIPILHVHGDKDGTVPLAANSAELAKRYQALGGEATVIVIPGKGHQVDPAFFQCQALADFLIKQAKATAP